MPTNPLDPFINDFKATGNLEADVESFLVGFEHTFVHMGQVAKKAVELARLFQGNESNVYQAAWLHDISTVIPNEQRVSVAQALGIELLSEEISFPMIIHQKLSLVIARDYFGIQDNDILSAITCHTTLKKGASLSDKIVFVADKIAWDQEGQPPYIKDIEAALDDSINAASLVYLNFLWEQRESLKVLHPWVSEARADLLS